MMGRRPVTPTTDSHPTIELAPGSELAGCRIEGIAGRGGMGIVYHATQLDLGRPVALKVIEPDRARDPHLRERFAMESRLAASIDHPNVVPIYAAGEESGHLYLVMRYVRGTDLHRLIRAEGRLSPARAARAVAQLASGLDAAHAAGLVHRDVKPANVLTDGEHVYLGDFGLTRVQDSDAHITESGAWVGTVDYMSPEHLRGDRCDARSDVYALGCLLVAALTGRPPFPHGTVPATMGAHLHEPPPRVSDRAPVPESFDAVVARALAKHPDDRYPSAGDLGRAAEAAVAGEPVTEVERTVARGAAAPTVVMQRESESETVQDATVALGRAPAAAEDWPERAPARTVRPWTRRAVLAGVLATAAVTAVAAAFGVFTGSGGASIAASGPLDGGEVRGAVDAFAGAVAAEDATALSRVLARDVQRVFPSDSQRGRPAVLDAYRGQFRTSAIVGYEISDLEVDAGRAGRATGTYRLERRGGPAVEGAIVFGVKRERGRAKVALIAATPG
jgi:tRNA A-37 threonylcarbamoyl transferase component Bud32/ketosteroid isomerase-like protein